jgi:hypothetical protein
MNHLMHSGRRRDSTPRSGSTREETFLRNPEEEPDDKATAERIARQSAHNTIVGGLLYRRGAGGVLMKCIHSATWKQLLDEIHAGQCGVHAASRTLVGKAFQVQVLLANSEE